MRRTRESTAVVIAAGLPFFATREHENRLSVPGSAGVAKERGNRSVCVCVCVCVSVCVLGGCVGSCMPIQRWRKRQRLEAIPRDRLAHLHNSNNHHNV